MWESVSNFWNNNQASIIVSLVVGAVFFILGPLGLWFSGKKVKREKILKAKSEILDLVESMLVNKEQVSVSKLLTLFRAIERGNTINLGIDTDLTNLLEDLTLRFAKSKHLSAEQKDAYIEQIDKLIDELNIQDKAAETGSTEQKRELPKSYKSIIEDLREEAKKVESDTLNKKIESLEKRLLMRSSDTIQNMARLIREKPQFRVLMYLYLISIVIMLLIRIFPELLK